MAFRAAARGFGVPLQVIADTLDEQRTAYGRRLILVRPDQYVGWTGNGPPADAAAVLRRAIGAAASDAAASDAAASDAAASDAARAGPGPTGDDT
jgi:hypothetical protein